MFRTFQGVSGHILPSPIEIHQFSLARPDHSVTHQHKAVFEPHLEPVLPDLLPADLAFLIGIIHDLPIPDKDTGRIIIFHQICLPIMENLQDAECCVGYFAHAADGKSLSDRLHAVFDGGPFQKHGSQDLGCQSGQNIGLHPASHTVRQNHDLRVFRL